MIIIPLPSAGAILGLVGAVIFISIIMAIVHAAATALAGGLYAGSLFLWFAPTGWLAAAGVLAVLFLAGLFGRKRLLRRLAFWGMILHLAGLLFVWETAFIHRPYQFEKTMADYNPLNEKRRAPRQAARASAADNAALTIMSQMTSDTQTPAQRARSYALYFPVLADTMLRKTGIKPDWTGYRAACLTKGGASFLIATARAKITGTDSCADLTVAADHYNLRLADALQADYKALQAYAARVSAQPATAPARITEGVCSGVVPARAVLRSDNYGSTAYIDRIGTANDPRCACLSPQPPHGSDHETAIDRADGRFDYRRTCPPLTAEIREKAPLADFTSFDFFTVRNCDYSALCGFAKEQGFPLELAGQPRPLAPDAAQKAVIIRVCLSLPHRQTADKRQRYCRCIGDELTSSTFAYSQQGIACLLRTSSSFDEDCFTGYSEQEEGDRLMARCVFR